MQVLREDFIHFHARQALKASGWTLVAGQYPGGSDDELPSLNVTDPTYARDRSPDHRRHSWKKLVPDLVAHAARVLLVVEMKPLYDLPDEVKLLELVGPRREDFERALDALTAWRSLTLPPARELQLVPCLGFSAGAPFVAREDFAYLEVDADGVVAFTQLPLVSPDESK